MHNSSDNPGKIDHYFKAAFWFLVVLILASIGLFYYRTTEIDFSKKIEPTIWGQFGDFVGGFIGTIISFFTIYVIWVNYKKEQNRFLQQQVNWVEEKAILKEEHSEAIKKYEQDQINWANEYKILQEQLAENRLNNKKQTIHNTFFQLLKIHSDIINSINYKEYEKFEYFELVKVEMLFIYDAIRGVFAQNFHGKQDVDTIQECQVVISISWLFCFYGVGQTSIHNLYKMYYVTIHLYGKQNGVEYEKEKIRETFNSFDNVLKKVKKEIKEEAELLPVDNTKHNIGFDGHHFRLSAYFRNLFSIVKYINSQDKGVLHYKEKYEYVKIVRNNLSDDEKAIFFYNSLSILGYPWEMEYSSKDILQTANKRLITKYNFLKGLPVRYACDVLIDNDGTDLVQKVIRFDAPAFYKLARFDDITKINKERLEMDKLFE